jgi:hypothetical protein
VFPRNTAQPKRRYRGSPVCRLFESKASQSDIAQLDWITLAIPGCINDALGDHF